MEALGMLLSIVAVLCGVGSLVCWILEIVAAFKNEESPLLGILSIVLCGLGGFVIGWIKHAPWGIRNIMLIWTALIVVSFVVQILMVMSGIGGVEPTPLPQV
jgi:hypothetical protein